MIMMFNYLSFKNIGTKSTTIILFLSFLLVGFIAMPHELIKADTEPFTIVERTEYGLTQNTVYVDIYENLGKDQNVNISNIFSQHSLTEQISYEGILLNQSHMVDDFGWANVSLGKYKTVTENVTELCYPYFEDCKNITSRYYTDNSGIELCWSYFVNDTEYFQTCNFILEDKSVLKKEWQVVGSHEEYDYLPVPGIKQKVVIGGQKIEQKHEGIPLPKNSVANVMFVVNHPIAYNLDVLEEVNKYNITVTSADGLDEVVLDPTWWNSSWKTRQLVHTDSGDVGSIFTDFLTYVKLDNSTGTYTDMQADWDDLRFVGIDNTTEFKYHIENYTSTVAHVWVNIPSVSSSANTSFWAFWNNSGASNNEDEANTYNSNYFSVHHLADTFLDSTSNDVDGTGTNMANATGKIAGGDEFDGTAYIAFGFDAFDTPLSSGGFTIEMWAKRGIMTGSTDHQMFSGEGYVNVQYDDNIPGVEGYNYDGGNDYVTGSDINEGEWYYIVMTHNTSHIDLYINGTGTGPVASTNPSMSPSDRENLFGTFFALSLFYNGTLDEVRISDIKRNDDWILASYESDRNDFLTFGTPEVGGDEGGYTPISLTLNHPTNTTYVYETIWINGTCNENCNATYSLNGGANQSIANTTTSFSQSLGILSEGSGKTVDVYVVNSTNSSDTDSSSVTFTVDYCNNPASGDWTISSGTTQKCEDENITLDANLKIYGTFSLNNTTIWINSDTCAEHGLTVYDGGCLETRNETHIRSEDNEEVTNSASHYMYFHVENGATLDINDTTIQDIGCGDSWAGEGVPFKTRGLWINASDTYIGYSTIKYTWSVIYYSDAIDGVMEYTEIYGGYGEGIATFGENYTGITSTESAHNLTFTNLTVHRIERGFCYGCFGDTYDIYINNMTCNKTYEGAISLSDGHDLIVDGGEFFDTTSFAHVKCGVNIFGGCVVKNAKIHSFSSGHYGSTPYEEAFWVKSGTNGLNVTNCEIYTGTEAFEIDGDISNFYVYNNNFYSITYLFDFDINDINTFNIWNNLLNTTNYIVGVSSSLNYWNTTNQTGTRITGLPGSQPGYIGGNYYTNSTGNGYSDTCADTDGDGYCDANYTMDANNIDYLAYSDAYGTVDVTAPTYSSNSTNSTYADTDIEHRLNWADETGLSGYIFEFCNGTYNGTDCNGSYVMKEYYNTDDDTQGAIYDTAWWGQTFNTSTGYDIKIVGVKVFKVGNPDTVTISIYPTNATGHPNCSASPLVSGSFNGSLITTSSPGEWANATFNTAYTLTASTTYAIIMNLTGDASNYIDWRLDGSSASYSGGTKGSSSDSGANWNMDAGDDMMFETYNIENEWTNDSWTSMTGTGNWSNVTKGIIDSVGVTVAWKVHANDTSDNWNDSDTYTYVTTSSGDSTSPTYSNMIEPSDPSTYSYGASYQFNCTWTDETAMDTVIIYENLTGALANHTVSTNDSSEYYYDVSDLAVGTYVYTWHVNDSSDNQNSTGEQTFTVNQATLQISLATNGTWDYLTQTNTTGAETNNGDSDVNYTLYRNDTLTDNTTPYWNNVTLGADYYQYRFNATSGENYTANSTGITIDITLSRISPSLNLLLNGTSANMTVETSWAVNITVDVNNAQGNITIYNDSSSFDTCASCSSLENTTAWSGAVGTAFNITGECPQSENYSAGSETWYININNSVPVLGELTNSSVVWEDDKTYYFNMTVYDVNGNDTIDTCIHEWNGSTNTTITTNYTKNSTALIFRASQLDLQDLSYTHKWFCNDTSGGWGNTTSQTYLVVASGTGTNGGGPSGPGNGDETNFTLANLYFSEPLGEKNITKGEREVHIFTLTNRGNLSADVMLSLANNGNDTSCNWINFIKTNNKYKILTFNLDENSTEPDNTKTIFYEIDMSSLVENGTYECIFVAEYDNRQVQDVLTMNVEGKDADIFDEIIETVKETVTEDIPDLLNIEIDIEFELLGWEVSFRLTVWMVGLIILFVILLLWRFLS